jgi:hypothetical protein
MQTISVEYPDTLAVAYLSFVGEVAPVLANDDLELAYEAESGGTIALIYPISGERVGFVEGLLLTYTGAGTLVSVEVADYHDAIISTEIQIGGDWLCGDADGSGGFDIDDVVYLVAYIFSSGPPPVPLNAGDVDCSGDVDVDDVVYIIMHIFGMGPPPCDPDNDGVPDC